LPDHLRFLRVHPLGDFSSLAGVRPVLLPELQKFDLLSDRRSSVIDELGVRPKIDGKVRRDSPELLGMMLQLTCVSGEYFDDRFQVFFHKRLYKEATPAARICTAGRNGSTG
jgi:hypothetical protein